MAEPGRAASAVTIPAAVLKRRVLVVGLTVAGLLLGVLASRAGGAAYQATAMFVVETPVADTSAASGAATVAVSPDRFVNDQVAIFDLETLQAATADIANQRLDERRRQALTGGARVGRDGAISVGQNGSVRLDGDDPGVRIEPDGSVRARVPDTSWIRPDGTVVGPDDQPLVGVDGDPLVVRSADTALVRDDGLIVVLQASAAALVVAPNGKLVDLTSLPAPSDTATTGTTTATGGPTTTGTTGDTEPQAGQSGSDGGAPVTGVNRTANGTLLVAFGDRSVRVEPTLRPVVLDPDGKPVPLPGRDDYVGVGQRLVLLDRSGVAAARSSDETVVVAGDDVVVLDRDARLVASTPGAVVQPGAEVPPAPVTVDAHLVRAGLSVRARPNSNLIEVHYTGATPELAQEVANAAVAAYQDLRSSGSGTERGAAQARAEQAVSDLSDQLVSVERQLTTAQLANPDRQALDAQYNEILRALAQAGRVLLDDPAQGATAAQRVRDLVSQLDAIERIERVELQQPALAELVNRRTQLQGRLGQLQAQLDSLKVDPKAQQTNVSLSSPATDAVILGGLGASRLGFVGAVLAFFAAAGVAYLLELRRPTVETVESAQDLLAVPLLTEIPDFKHERIDGSLPVLTAPTTFAAEAFRIGAATAGIGFPEDRGAIIGVVSAGVGDGKTTVATNLAIALAQTRRRVLALDADLEGQVMSFLLRDGTGPTAQWRGMIDIVEGRALLAEAVQTVVSERGMHIDLLAAGSEGVRLRGVLDTKEAAALFEEVKEKYDVVVVDMPPALNVSYASHLLREVDGAVVVVSAGNPSRPIRELQERLAFVGAKVVGFVFNRGPLRSERRASVAALHYNLGGRGARGRRPGRGGRREERLARARRPRHEPLDVADLEAPPLGSPGSLPGPGELPIAGHGPEDHPGARAEGSATGAANGTADSVANGTANGVTNGAAIGGANGMANGAATGGANGAAAGGANGMANGTVVGAAHAVAAGRAGACRDDDLDVPVPAHDPAHDPVDVPVDDRVDGAAGDQARAAANRDVDPTRRGGPAWRGAGLLRRWGGDG